MSLDSPPRAVVVDDSALMRTIIADILSAADIEVVATASDGEEALERVLDSDPDVVTMDVEMPGVDGLEAVRRIMAEHPTPILMLSAHTREGASVTFEALDHGAVDFFPKPGGEVSAGMARFESQLVENVIAVARSEVGQTATSAPTATLPGPDPEALTTDATVVIGASTGGPSAVERVLGALPLDAGLRVIVVQHMPEGFTARFAERLDGATEYAVHEATDASQLGGGEAVVAKGGYHLVVADDREGRLHLNLRSAAPDDRVCPSIDETLESAATCVEHPLVAVVLTGMGADGAAGVQRVKASGGTIIAQDEATSAVFGMPKRAIETGCVDAVLPLGSIPGAVVRTVSRGARA